MNTKGIKFLAVLAVMVMAFAAIVVIAPSDIELTGQSTSSTSSEVKLIVLDDEGQPVSWWTDTADIYNVSWEDGMTAQLYADLELTKDFDEELVTLELMKKGLSIDVKKDVTLTSIVKYGSSAVFVPGLKAGEGDAFITAGSVEFSGTLADDLELTPLEGKIVLMDLDATGYEITVTDGTEVHVKGIVKGDIILNDGATLIIEDGGDISEATIDTTNGGNIEKNTDESKMAEKEISGEVARTADGHPIDYSADQLVVVVGECTLLKGAEVDIRGALLIPEGTKLVVSAGAILKIKNDATVHVEGTLEIEEAETNVVAGLVQVDSGNIDVTGTLNDNGLIELYGNENFPASVTINAGAIALIDDEGAFATGDAEGTNPVFEVKSKALLTVTGKMGDAIENSGIVLINSTACADNNTTINLVSEYAIVDVQNYTVLATALKELDITDNGLVFTTYWDRILSEDVPVQLKDTYDKVAVTQTLTGATADYSVTFGGLIVTATTSFTSADEEIDADNGIYNYKQYSKALDVAGSFFADYSYIGSTTSGEEYTAKANVATSVVGGDLKKYCGVTVTGEVDVNDNMTFSNAANMTVTGTILTTFANSSMTNTGTIFVTGPGYIKSCGKVINSENGVSAAKFVTTTSSTTSASAKVYNYYSIDGALALASTVSPKEIIVLGNTQVMTVDAELPAPVALVLDNGSSFTVMDGVFFNVEKGSTVKGAGTIYVDGTMYAENKSNVKTSTVDVISDVKTEELDEKGRPVKDGWAKWTNLASAVQEALPGETVTVTKTNEEGYVVLSKNLTIPENILVSVPDGTKGLLLLNGVTLTVDGTLFVESNIFAEQAFGLDAQKLKMKADPDYTNRYSSAIIVNGELITAGSIDYGNGAASAEAADTSGAYSEIVALIDGQYLVGKHITFENEYDGDALHENVDVTAPIAGAYYQMRYEGSTYNVISSLPAAMANLEDIRNGITIHGEVDALAVEFTATKYINKITVAADDVTAPTSIEDDSAVPTVLSVLSLALDESILEVLDEVDSEGAFNGIVGNDANGGASVVFRDITGVTVEDKDGKLSLYGAASALGDDSIIEVAAGTVYLGTSNTQLDYDENDTFKAFTVASGATAVVENFSADMVSISGTLEVPANKTATIAAMYVYDGTVSVAEGTSSSSPGTLSITGAAFFGITEYDYENGAPGVGATLNGPFKPNNALIAVSSKATVDSSAALVLLTLKSTTFVVDGKEWFTLYKKDAQNIELTDEIPVENARCDGWYDDYMTKYNIGTQIQIGAPSVVYAVINYDIYDIVVYTDNGIKSVAIDGIELFNQQTNRFITINPIKAGTHTISFTLMDGYEGTPILYTYDVGDILKDYKFTVSGTDEDRETGDRTYLFEYQLYGTEKEEVAPAPTPEEESQWTITTILLVILVVLIAIMAVIVALRLNRS